jgi:hypothetical protein
LIAWELGAGWGHVARLRPIARTLQQHGHEVVVALRDVAATGSLFTRFGIPCIAAPFKLGWPSNSIRPAISFAHILHNVGFADADELAPLVAAWDALYDLVEPDVILFDHSPTALLASRDRSVARVVVGDGFCCPPSGDLMPILAPWRPNDGGRLRADERHTLAVANRVLVARGAAPLSRLTDIYHEAAEHVFTTFAELDHFGPRDVRYIGPAVEAMDGAAHDWPASIGPRAIGYVRFFPELPQLLRLLATRGVSTLLYCPGANAAQLGCHPLVRIVDRPLDLRWAARDADFAILNASHGTTLEMLLMGLPILQLPLHTEQQLVAYRSSSLGAAVVANRTKPGQVATQIEQLLNDSRHRSIARSIAERYRGYDRLACLGATISRIESLCMVAA